MLSNSLLLSPSRFSFSFFFSPLLFRSLFSLFPSLLFSSLIPFSSSNVLLSFLQSDQLSKPSRAFLLLESVPICQQSKYPSSALRFFPSYLTHDDVIRISAWDLRLSCAALASAMFPRCLSRISQRFDSNQIQKGNVYIINVFSRTMHKPDVLFLDLSLQ